MACQACGRNAPTKYVEFYQNIGMLVMRSMRTTRGNLCKRCIKKYFLKVTGLTLVTGWWGMISLILNPFLIINNVFRYLTSLGMADGGEGAMPVVEGGMQGGMQPSGQRVVASPGRVGVVPPPPPPPALSGAATATTALASYRQDIVLRLRGGESPAQIAAFIAPRAGVSAATVQAYAESLRGKS
jgi:hypothetical protein